MQNGSLQSIKQKPSLENGSANTITSDRVKRLECTRRSRRLYEKTTYTIGAGQVSARLLVLIAKQRKLFALGGGYAVRIVVKCYMFYQ